MKKIILMAGVLLCTLGLTLGIAQTETEEETAEVAGFAYGQVVNVSSKSIVITEYDYDIEASKQVTFIINSETKYENVESYNEIENGDEVEIRYKEENGQKVAEVISKETTWEILEDDEYNSEDDEEEYQEKEYIEDDTDATRG